MFCSFHSKHFFPVRRRQEVPSSYPRHLHHTRSYGLRWEHRDPDRQWAAGFQQVCPHNRATSFTVCNRDRERWVNLIDDYKESGSASLLFSLQMLSCCRCYFVQFEVDVCLCCFRMNSSPSSGSVSPFSLTQDKCPQSHNQLSNNVSLCTFTSLIIGAYVPLIWWESLKWLDFENCFLNLPNL